MNWGWIMYLHKEDRELLKDIIATVAEKTGIDESIVEKDYYVTMILRELAGRNTNVVFKGGTSLSKAYHVIDRFSEDIDITFDEHLGEARRKKVKYQLLKPISEDLSLPIENWNHIESDKDYNHYDFGYESLGSVDLKGLRPYVKLETALMSYAYPTERRQITSIIYDCLAKEEPEIIQEYHLEPFEMKVQALSRTVIDKMFAVCDYYMIGRATRNSRHLYDLYKLRDYIALDDSFKSLFNDVRMHRAEMDIKVAPSARSNVDVYAVAQKLIQEDFYADDYENSTVKLISDDVSYETVKENYYNLMKKLET